MKYTIQQFRKDYADDAACLEKIFQIRYGNAEACPRCGIVNPIFTRISTRVCYQCKDCGHQIYPMAGTIFQKSTTPLTHWFYAIYLMIVTRNGLAAKELQRHLGVTYKTAWRMNHQIRMLMAEHFPAKLSGTVEIDETFIGGKKAGAKGRPKDGNKHAVLAMVQRSGKVISMKLDNLQKVTIYPIIKENVEESTKIMTDDFLVYRQLRKEGYKHKTICHSAGIYVKGEVHTNTVEGFFSHLKRMIHGSYIYVSKKHLNKYVAECVFRYNNREYGNEMFDVMLSRLSEPFRPLKS